MAAILEAMGLHKTYGAGPTAVHALKQTDLAVERGEFLAICGASGSGKSTLLHLLAGLDRPTGGRVSINGTELCGLDDDALAVFRRRHIGFIFQFFNLIPVLSAEENVALPLLLDGCEDRAGHVAELMAALGLAERRHHLPDALSGGQQQRVAIARALANEPAVVFADEPTGNLDTGMAGEVLNLLRASVQRYGQTLVVVTHDANVAAYADRVVTLRDGVVVSNGGGRR